MLTIFMMKWTVEHHEKLEEWLNTLSAEIKAKILRIVEMLVCYEPHNIKEPYVKPVKGYKKLFEIRAREKDGLARVFYFTRQLKVLRNLLILLVLKNQPPPKAKWR
ncbi:MAG: type II toxin-antitoxin system RelE/ParE family toxin [bacterium]|nr:type II toxin-antitoxin system RelE/ParE family toxin [bacterium]